MKKFLMAAAALAAFAGTSASATALLPGTGRPVGVVFTAFDPNTAGTLLASQSQTGQAAVNPTFNATLRSAVYRNTFGTLDFWYQVSVNTMDPGEFVTGLTAAAFSNYAVDAMFSGAAAGDPDGGGIFIAPANPGGFTSTASRSGGPGFTIRADFNANGLVAGETSATYIYRTNAFSFNTLGNFSAVDGSTVTFGNYQPTGAVPEPATWGLMILGFGLVGAAMRNRRRAVVAA